MSTEEPVPEAETPEAPEEPIVEKPSPFSKDAMEAAIEAAKPALTKMSLGGVMGYCSGMALKKVGKAMAFVVGLGFVGLQTAAYCGYITVNWGKVADDAIVKPLDTTGDGKLDTEDLKAWWKKVKAILTYQLPDAAGFSTGFLFGVKHG